MGKCSCNRYNCGCPLIIPQPTSLTVDNLNVKNTFTIKNSTTNPSMPKTPINIKFEKSDLLNANYTITLNNSKVVNCSGSYGLGSKIYLNGTTNVNTGSGFVNTGTALMVLELVSTANILPIPTTFTSTVYIQPYYFVGEGELIASTGDQKATFNTSGSTIDSMSIEPATYAITGGSGIFDGASGTISTPGIPLSTGPEITVPIIQKGFYITSP